MEAVETVNVQQCHGDFSALVKAIAARISPSPLVVNQHKCGG